MSAQPLFRVGKDHAVLSFLGVRMTGVEFAQLMMLSRAVLRARDSIKDDETLPSELRKQAVRTLSEISVRSPRLDMKLRQAPYHLNGQELAKLRNVFCTFLSEEAVLSDFGKTPWGDIVRAFERAQCECPLSLRELHKEYQKELASGGARIPHPAPTIPPGAREL